MRAKRSLNWRQLGEGDNRLAAKIEWFRCSNIIGWNQARVQGKQTHLARCDKSSRVTSASMLGPKCSITVGPTQAPQIGTLKYEQIAFAPL